MEKGSFKLFFFFENLYKINQTSYNDNFCFSGNQEKKKISISETKLGVSGNVTYAYLFPTLSLTNLMGYFHEQPSSSVVRKIRSPFILLTIPGMSWHLMIT